jgi:hypothetical protein
MTYLYIKYKPIAPFIMKEENNNEITNQKPKRKLNNSHSEVSIMILLGITGAIAWIIMFGLGLLVNSQVYRDSILKEFEWINFLMSILTYTPTNIALLCLISAFSGGSASRLLVSGIAKNSEPNTQQPEPNTQQPEPNTTDSHHYMTENPFSSMLRGLVVYFTFLGGVFIATPNPFANTTAAQYAQSAGVVSLLSFVVGYDPTVFRSFISLAGKIKQKPE